MPKYLKSYRTAPANYVHAPVRKETEAERTARVALQLPARMDAARKATK
jgi:hypothetical protein